MWFVANPLIERFISFRHREFFSLIQLSSASFYAAKQKLDLSGPVVSVCCEEDGTDVEENEVFLSYEAKSTFIVLDLSKGQTWRPVTGVGNDDSPAPKAVSEPDPGPAYKGNAALSLSGIHFDISIYLNLVILSCIDRVQTIIGGMVP